MCNEIIILNKVLAVVDNSDSNKKSYISQTRYENSVSGPITNPIFNELYTPLDTIIGNLVLKVDF
jgi:hypothetical protein